MYTEIIFENKVVDFLPKFKLNSFGQTIDFNVFLENGDILDLGTDGYTAVFKAIPLSSFNNNEIDEVCTVVTTTASYAIVTGNLDAKGTYDACLVISKAGQDIKLPLGYLEVFE